jgi:hypothetical protein
MNMVVKVHEAAEVASPHPFRSPYEFSTATEEVLELADMMMEEHSGQQPFGRLLKDLVQERDALRAALVQAGRQPLRSVRS